MVSSLSATSSPSPSGWTTDRLAGALGARVSGALLAKLSDEEFAYVRELLHEHQVLFFPGQHLSIDEHVAFGRRFGPLEAHPHLKNPFTQHPQLFELAASAGGIADEWHTDLTFRPDPSVLSVLQIKACPAAGGDTMWSNLNAAYEALSEPIRELCDGLTALHDAAVHGRPEQVAVHPVVRRHPETGRKALYVNEYFTKRIVELSASESDVWLRYLTQWVTQPRFTVRYRWSEGDVAIWDNRCTQHFVLNDFTQERIIHRVTVMGDLPEGEAPRWSPWVQRGHRSAATYQDLQLIRQLSARPRS